MTEKDNDMNETKELLPAKTIEFLNDKKIDFSFLSSHDPHVLNDGIESALSNIKWSVLCVSIAMARIKIGYLYRDLGFNSFFAYCLHLSEKYGVSRSGCDNWAIVGEHYLRNLTSLRKIGFDEDFGINKLKFIDIATQNHGQYKALNNLKTLSAPEYYKWAEGSKDALQSVKLTNANFRDASLFQGSEKILTFSSKVPKDKQQEISKYIISIYAIIEKGETPIIGVDKSK